MQPKVFTLKTGLTVIFIDTETFPTLTTLLMVGAGSRYENENNNGIAHFFEHMAFKGSKKYPSSFIISSTVEGLGGVFNAFTSKDHTGYWIKSTTAHFATVVDVISDMVLNPLLVPEEIDREKGVITEEINLYEDMPYRKVSDLFEGLLYKGNPLGFDIAGEKKTVKSFDRKTFTDYIAELYHPKNAVLVVAGGLSKTPLRQGFPLRSSNSEGQAAGCINDYLEIVEKKFGNWEDGKRASFIKVEENQTRPGIFIKSKKTEQAHFCLGFRAFSFFDKRKHILSVLSAILGGGMSSRLFIEVRERRGLCYYISTGREFYHDVGNIVTQAGVTNNLDKVKEAIETILKEKRKVANGEVTSEELKKAKELLKGRLLLSMEDSFNIASFLGTKKILEDKIETPEEIIAKIDKVTREEVVALAKELFVPSRLNFALIGPFEKQDFDESLFTF